MYRICVICVYVYEQMPPMKLQSVSNTIRSVVSQMLEFTNFYMVGCQLEPHMDFRFGEGFSCVVNNCLARLRWVPFTCAGRMKAVA